MSCFSECVQQFFKVRVLLHKFGDDLTEVEPSPTLANVCDRDLRAFPRFAVGKTLRRVAQRANREEIRLKLRKDKINLAVQKSGSTRKTTKKGSRLEQKHLFNTTVVRVIKVMRLLERDMEEGFLPVELTLENIGGHAYLTTQFDDWARAVLSHIQMNVTWDKLEKRCLEHAFDSLTDNKSIRSLFNEAFATTFKDKDNFCTDDLLLEARDEIHTQVVAKLFHSKSESIVDQYSQSHTGRNADEDHRNGFDHLRTVLRQLGHGRSRANQKVDE